MGTNQRKRQRNLTQIIIVLLFITGAYYGVQYYKKIKESENYTKAYFESSNGARSSEFSLEVADNEYKIRRGLMFREEMGPEKGMLFIMPEEKIHSFWMKNTYISLDIIFVDSDMKVVSVSENLPILTEKSVKGDKPSKYVVELNAGMAKKNGIVAGSTLQLIK